MKKFLKRFLIFILTIVLIVSSVIVYFGYQEYRNVIEIMPLELKIAEVRGRDSFVDVAQIPDMVERAMIGVEDKRFYQRTSVLDYRSVARATWQNIKSMSLVEGGSNIPQQVSKNLYFDHSASLVRKVSEFFVTRDLLKLQSKDEILELYLNIAYFGDGYFGIQNAAKGYFDIDVAYLSDAQATLLVGIVQSPANFELSQYYERAKVRQQTVLQRLVEQNVLTPEQAEALYLEDVYGG